MRIDLHRHLSGSINAETVKTLLDKQGHKTPLDIIKRRISFDDGEYGFHTFLDKFKIFDSIKWDEEAIRLTISQICWDMVHERLDYVELKFSVDKYLKFGFDQDEVVDIIYNAVQEESARWGIKVALVLSLKYEANRDLQRRISRLINSKSDYLFGLDLF